MTKFMSMVGKKVYLNPLQENDIPILANYMNDDHIKVYGRNCGSAVYEKQMKDKLEGYQKDQTYVIFREDTNIIIGDISINSIDIYNRSGTLSIMIYGEENRRKGFGIESIQLMLKHAFIDINLESVQLGTWEFNKPAIHLYEKVGFKIIGRHRHRRIIGNKYYDEILMDIISQEYFELYGNEELKKYEI